MKLAIHQLRTDVWRVRWWLAAAWISFAAPIPLTRLPLPVSAPELNSIMQALLLIFQMLVVLFVVVRVVQSNALVGSTAGWMTRPVRRAHLFAATTVIFILGLLLPRLLFQTLDWVWRGLSFELWLAAAAESLLFGVAYIFTVAVLAALTRDLPRFFLATGLAAGGLLVWGGLLELLDPASLRRGSSQASALVVAISLLTASVLLGWIFQALAGRRRWSLIALSCGLLAFQPTLLTWPVDFLKPQAKAAPLIGLTLVAAHDSPAPQPGRQLLWSHFLLSNLPPKQFAVVQEMDATFVPSGGRRGYRLESGGLQHYYGENPPVETTDQAIDYYRVVQSFFPPETLWFASDPPGEQPHLPGAARVFEAHTDRSLAGSFDGELKLRVFKAVKGAELPVAPGSTASIPGVRVTLKRIASTSDGLEIEIEESRVELMFDRTHGAGPTAPDRWRRQKCAYVLYHPRSGEAFTFDWRGQGFFGGFPGLLSKEALLHRKLAVPYPALRERLAGISANEWLREARLCVFLPVYVGSTHEAFETEDYVLSNSGIGWRADTRAGMEAIERAALPENPDEAELAGYLDAILNSLPDEWSHSTQTRIESKLMAIGFSGVPALVRRLPLEGRADLAAHNVLRSLATREHLPGLRDALGRDPALATLFIENGWEAEARDVLVEKLSDRSVHFRTDALRIAAGARNPGTYDDLKWHFVRLGSSHERVIPLLENCPGFDVAGAVRDAWKRATLGLIDTRGLAVAAAAQGLPEAFRTAVIQMEETSDDRRRQRDAVRLAALTLYDGPAEGAPEWLSANLGRFRYDEVRGRYVLAAGRP